MQKLWRQNFSWQYTCLSIFISNIMHFYIIFTFLACIALFYFLSLIFESPVMCLFNKLFEKFSNFTCKSVFTGFIEKLWLAGKSFSFQLNLIKKFWVLHTHFGFEQWLLNGIRCRALSDLFYNICFYRSLLTLNIIIYFNKIYI